jgi:FHS family L-fucose permease-like MFS transporter
MKQKQAIAIIGLLFFIFGFVTWLNGMLIPYLRIACELNNFESYFVVFAFYIATVAMAIPSSWIIKKIGFRNGIAVGLLIMAAGAALFIPAALTRTYFTFLLGLFVIGSGMTVLQAASNPYITFIGPISSAAKRMSIMGIFNKTAGILSPLVLGAFILKENEDLEAGLATLDAIERAAQLDELASRVIVPYLGMTAILIGLSLFIRFSGLPEIDTGSNSHESKPIDQKNRRIYHFPNLVLGVLSLFLYIGVEVIAGDTIISYGVSQGIPLLQAKSFTSLTLSAMLSGYVLGILLMPRYITQEKALQVSAVMGLIFSVMAIFTSGFVSVLFIALLGLANAVMWPAHWPLAIKGLGKFTSIGSSWLVMAISGGAIIPLAYGYLADISSTRQAYWLLIPCYLFILFYAVKGHKKESW